ncbi:hypothetical protein ACIRJO_18040 [Streptomyces sp. NPDC102394]|uniref:hypothetical protein n=1 Tax=Streptomyces sp. NPDC102394 TaxID=3366167 RepID=UPI0038167B91
MPDLTDPLDDAQQCLVDLLWSTFVEHGEFPKFFYVNHHMRHRGHNTIAVLNSFPAVGTVLTHRYRAVGWWGADHNPDNDGLVFLTLAGLYHVRHDPAAEIIRRSLLVFMRDLAQAQDAILDSPFNMPNVDVELATSVKQVDAEGAYIGHAAAIAEREWPGIHYNKGSGTGRLGTLAEADFSTVAEYLVAVTTTLSPPEPPTALPYTEPRALLRAFNFLDVTSELVLGHRLVSRPPMDRSSLLALDVEDEAGFQAGLVVLTDILRDLQVPGRTPTAALGRLEGHLVVQLPAIDQAAIRQAVELLDQIRVLRNSAVHPKPSARILAAHQALGLPFPVRDFTAAWDSVRTHAERALSRVQEEIQAARP